MVSWQAFPSLPPWVPLALAFLSRLKLPFPPLSNTCHAGYHTAWSKIPIIFTWTFPPCLCFNPKYAFQYTFKNNNTKNEKKEEDKREQRGDLHDDIRSGLPIQFLTPPNRAKLKWCYYKTEFPKGYCEIHISSLRCSLVQYQSKLSYHVLVRHESHRVLRNSCSVRYDSLSTWWPKNCKYHGQNSWAI